MPPPAGELDFNSGQFEELGTGMWLGINRINSYLFWVLFFFFFNQMATTHIDTLGPLSFYIFCLVMLAGFIHEGFASGSNMYSDKVAGWSHYLASFHHHFWQQSYPNYRSSVQSNDSCNKLLCPLSMCTMRVIESQGTIRSRKNNNTRANNNEINYADPGFEGVPSMVMNPTWLGKIDLEPSTSPVFF